LRWTVQIIKSSKLRSNDHDNKGLLQKQKNRSGYALVRAFLRLLPEHADEGIRAPGQYFIKARKLERMFSIALDLGRANKGNSRCQPERRRGKDHDRSE